MAGWGIGIGGFMQGLAGGIRTRQALDASRDQRVLRGQQIEMNEMRLNETRRQLQQQHTLDSVGAYLANEYRKAAEADAEVKAHPGEWWAEHGVPQIKQVLNSMGRYADAEGFGKFVAEKNNQKMLRHKAQLNQKIDIARQTGDFEPVADAMRKFYNGLPNEYRDGAKFDRLDLAKDANGAITQIVPVFKTKKGQEFKQPFNNETEMRDTFDTVFNPVSAWLRKEATMAAAEKLRGTAATEKVKSASKVWEKQQEQKLGIGGQPDDIVKRIEKAKTALSVEAGFDKMAPADQDLAIAEYLRRQDKIAQRYLGLGGPTQQTPQAQPEPAAPARAPAQPLSQGPAAITAPRPQAQQPAEDQTQSEEQPSSPTLGIRPSPYTGMPQTDRRQTGIPIAPNLTDNTRQPPPTELPTGIGTPPSLPEATAAAQRQTGVAPAPAVMPWLDQINAQRRAKGLPALTPQQAAEALGLNR